MRRRPAAVLLCSLLCPFGAGVHAAGGVDAVHAAGFADPYPPGARRGGPYAELQLGASGVRHSALDFVSPIASVSVGTYLYPGIGIELFADGALGRGGDGRFEAGVSEAFGVGARFRSPSRAGLHGYIVLGYVDFTVEQESLDDEREIEEDFTGARIGVGLMQRFVSAPNLAVSAEYRAYYVADSIQVDALLLGLRLDVR